MPYIGPPPQNRILSSADIAQGAVTLDDINFTDQPTNMDITGLIDKHTMRLADGVTITGDVTISDDLVLSKISDDGNAITMTNDGSSRTITGSGSIEASTLSQTPNQSLTGMTGTIGSAVVGSPALNLTTTTSFPTGHCLKVLSTTKTDTWTSSGNAAWDDITGLSVTITPTATSNKILVFGVTYTGQATDGDVMTRIVRGSTPICIGDSSGSKTSTTTGGSIRNVYETLAHPYNFLDSPSTTSATTYKIQMWNGATGYVNRSSNDADNVWAERLASTITVMEIAG